MPVALLWDMDGTLVDTEPHWMAAERALVNDAGRQWSHDVSTQTVGQDLLVAAEFIRAHYSLPHEPEEVVELLLERVVAAVSQCVPWRPGAKELLVSATQRGMPSALVTMSWRKLVDPIVAALPHRVFSSVVSGDEVAQGKPHPEPYLTAAYELGVPPESCLAIEDSIPGVISATSAGVPTLAVRHLVDIPPMPGTLFLESLADITVDDLPDLHLRAAATFGADTS